jgi:hypothetical protein
MTSFKEILRKQWLKFKDILSYVTFYILRLIRNLCQDVIYNSIVFACFILFSWEIPFSDCITTFVKPENCLFGYDYFKLRCSRFFY